MIEALEMQLLEWWNETKPLPRPQPRVQSAVSAMDASRAQDSDIQVPCPAGLTYKAYQRAGIAFIWRSRAGALLADAPGLGKTIQAAGVVNLDPSIKRILVVCPNTLKLNWVSEFERWLVRPSRIGIATGKQWPDTDVVIVNYDVIHRWRAQLEQPWDLAILDEAHYCKNLKSIRAKAAFGYKPTAKQQKEGAEVQRGINARIKLPMTGTPILNKPMELFSILHWLDPVRWDNGFKFGIRYAGAYRKKIPWMVKGKVRRDKDGKAMFRTAWDFGGASNLDELQRELRGGGYMIRRLKEDVLQELPPKIWSVIELEADEFEDLLTRERQEGKAHTERLEQLRTQCKAAKLSDNPERYAKAVEALREGQAAMFCEMARVRYETGMAKVPQVVEFATNALEHGKILLFVHHLDVMEKLKEAFPQAVMVYGDVKLEARQAAVKRFQTDSSCNVFIGNDAAAEGLTLTAANHVIFAEADWVPGKLAQKADRAHRIGQRDSVLVTCLVLAGSIDARMVKRCVRKQDVINKALDL